MPTLKAKKHLKEPSNKLRTPDELTIFPTLTNYKTEHTLNEFKKLCSEIIEFCNQVYASTRNEDERKVYRDMVAKINK